MRANHSSDDLLPVTFLARVSQREEGCWLWTAGRDRHGYGLFKHEGRRRLVHRLAYELFIGPIPEGLEIDHLCRNRLCVNPSHMEPVTHLENMLRAPRWSGGVSTGTACSKGHEFTPENTYVEASGKRWCRECRRQNQRAYQRRKDDRGEAA